MRTTTGRAAVVAAVSGDVAACQADCVAGAAMVAAAGMIDGAGAEGDGKVQKDDVPRG